MNIQEFRQQYPEYEGKTDRELSDALYQKFYTHVDRKEFDSRFLGNAPVPAPQPSPTDPMAEMVESAGMFQPGTLAPSTETLREQAPVMGGMATMPFKTSPILAPISGMAASGAALMAGRGVEPMMQGQTPDIMAGSLGQFNAPLEPFLVGAGAELGGQAIAKGIEKIAAPYAKSFAERVAGNQQAKMAQEMVDAGIPISPAEYQPTKATRAFQWIADNIMPGNLIANKRRQEVSNAILKMRQEFIEEGMELPKFTESIPQAQAKTRELFGKFKTELGGDVEAKIPMTNAVKYIEDNTFTKLAESDPKKWWTKRLLPWAQGGEEKTLSEINSLNASYNRYWSQLTPDQQKLRKGLHEAYLKDLAEYDAKTGFKLEQTLTKAQESAQHRYDIVKARYIENALLEPATKIEDQAYVFYPTQFKTQINKNLTKIEQMFGQEGLDTINQFADKMMIAASDMGKLNKVSDATAAMRKATGIMMGGPAAAFATGQPALGAALSVPFGFSAFTAKSLMDPSGWLRKWLTTGTKPPTLLTKEVPKLGILEAGND